MVDLMNHKIFLRFWLAHASSLFGDAFSLVAWIWILTELSGSATGIGVVFAAFSAPQVLLLLLGGVVSDRFNTRGILLTTEFANAGLTLLLILLYRADLLSILTFSALSVAFGTVQAFSNPAFGIAWLRLIDREQIFPANRLRQISGNTVALVGPIAGGWCIHHYGISAALAVDLASFLLLAVIVLTLPTAEFARASAVTDAAGQTGASEVVPDGLTAAFRFVLSTSGLLVLTVVFSLSNGINNVEQTVVPLIARDDLGMSAAAYGFLPASLAAGGIVGAVLIGPVKAAGRSHVFLASSGLVLFGVALGLIGLARHPWHLFVLYLLLGVGFAVPEISNGTLIQSAIPDHLRGRVFSLLSAISMAANPVGFLASGAVADALGRRTTVVASGAVIALLGAVLHLARPVRRIDASLEREESLGQR